MSEKVTYTPFSQSLVDLVNEGIDDSDGFKGNKENYLAKILDMSKKCYEIGKEELEEIEKQRDNTYKMKEQFETLTNFGVSEKLLKGLSRMFATSIGIMNFSSAKKAVEENQEENLKKLNTYKKLVDLVNNRHSTLEKIHDYFTKDNNLNELEKESLENSINQMKEICLISNQLKCRQERLLDLDNWFYETLYKKA